MDPAISSTTPDNSTAFINGSIYTINPAQPWASGFIVSPDGNFTKVGSTSDILAEAQKLHLVVVDLHNKFVMPGIHDAHMHLLYAGLFLTSDANIGMETTHANIAQKIKEGSCACKYVNAYQDWILANSLNSQGFPDMAADRKYLDELFPDQPVIVRGGAAHSMLLNTAALEIAGYNVENEPDVQGAKFGRRADGSLTGELMEKAMTKAALSIKFPSLAHIKRVLKHALSVAHRAGVTSLQEASGNSLVLRALSEIEKEGGLRTNIHTHIVYGPEWVANENKESLHRLLDEAKSFKSKHVDTRFVKIILDGVPLVGRGNYLGG